MTITIINGGQYGDEGKGKIVDYLADYYDIGIRSTAGDNAGHTICVGSTTLKMRLIPSTILKSRYSLITDDVMINPITLDEEILSLNKAGVDCKNKLMISPNAHIVLPYHKTLDALFEAGATPIGTTKRGIGPAMADKVNRIGIRMEEFINPKRFTLRLTENVKRVNMQIKALYSNDVEIIDEKKIYQEFLPISERLRLYVTNTVQFIHTALDQKCSIIIEGAQGSMNDLTYGSYPYVTSSRPVSGGLLAGAAIGPTYVDHVLSVIKPYQTRVGIGPVMAEIFGEVSKHICDRGKEYGTVTGRQRRVMWFDSALVNYTRRINGTTAFALAKLDVLDEIEEIKICTAYVRNGKKTEVIPLQTEIEMYEPNYITLPGWKTPISHIRDYKKLPTETKNFIEKIEELTNTPIVIVSVGSDREHTIDIKSTQNIKPGKTQQTLLEKIF